jgi:hypothetical protein
MTTIHRAAPDKVNGETEKGYTVDMTGTRNANLFVGSPKQKSQIWRHIAQIPDPEVD